MSAELWYFETYEHKDGKMLFVKDEVITFSEMWDRLMAIFELGGNVAHNWPFFLGGRTRLMWIRVGNLEYRISDAEEN